MFDLMIVKEDVYRTGTVIRSGVVRGTRRKGRKASLLIRVDEVIVLLYARKAI